jgi:hypothetical protein
MEFYNNARKLRENITGMLILDFGARGKNIKTEKTDNCEITVIEGYPDWFVTEFRQNILRRLRSLMLNITAGNTIYPETVREAADRRRYQTKAIISCQQLLQEMQYCAETLPVKKKWFLDCADSIGFEIRLLKSWRKSTNRIAKNLKNDT